MEEKKFIEIDKILAEKAPGLKNWLPRFLLNWLKRKLHEDDINKIMFTLRDCRELEFNTRGLEELGVKVQSVKLIFSTLIICHHDFGSQLIQ